MRLKTVCFFTALLVTPLNLPAQTGLEDIGPTAAEELASMMVSTFRSAEGQQSLKQRDRRVRLSSEEVDGVWIYQQLNVGEDNVLGRQSIVQLIEKGPDTVVQKNYTPMDGIKWQNAWDKPEVITSLSNTDYEPSFDNGCDQTWTKVDGTEWRGYVDPNTCKRSSTDDDKKDSIEIESILGLKTLRKAERAFDTAGQQVSGNQPGDFVVMDRQYDSSSSVVRFSAPEDWRPLNSDNLLLMELASGEVLFELAPEFAPRHVENIKQLVTSNYFDGLKIIRSQDNYVAQWGDPASETEQERSLGKVKVKLPPEFFRAIADVNFTPIESRDAYAEQVGLVRGFPVASDGKRAWLTHCYGMLGVARGTEPDSGNGSGLYVVTGHSPRHLDRNVTLAGRVLSGMRHLSSLPRGTGPLGFYEDEKDYITIFAMHTGDKIPLEKRSIEVMRTDTKMFAKYVELRTNRLEDWFLEPTGKIELCNVAVPTRALASEAAPQ